MLLSLLHGATPLLDFIYKLWLSGHAGHRYGSKAFHFTQNIEPKI